jgi:hypothetical protein
MVQRIRIVCLVEKNMGIKVINLKMLWVRVSVKMLVLEMMITITVCL